MTRRQALLGLGIVAVGAALWLGSGPKRPMLQGQLRATVVPAAAGAPATDAEVRAAADRVDAALAGIGIARRDVSPLPGGQIRIVIPESQAARLPEIRTLLADPKYRVRTE